MFCKWLGTYLGWDVFLTLSVKRDVGFYNDFQLSATLQNCIEYDKSTFTEKKYILFELFNMRLFELRFEKIIYKSLRS